MQHYSFPTEPYEEGYDYLFMLLFYPCMAATEPGATRTTGSCALNTGALRITNTILEIPD